MDGSERQKITPPPEDEPRYLRRSRNIRAAWNELYPIALSVVLLGVLGALALKPELRDPSFLSMIGTALIALGGLGLRKKRP